MVLEPKKFEKHCFTPMEIWRWRGFCPHPFEAQQPQKGGGVSVSAPETLTPRPLRPGQEFTAVRRKKQRHTMRAIIPPSSLAGPPRLTGQRAMTQQAVFPMLMMRRTDASLHSACLVCARVCFVRRGVSWVWQGRAGRLIEINRNRIFFLIG